MFWRKRMEKGAMQPTAPALKPCLVLGEHLAGHTKTTKKDAQPGA